MPAIHLGGAINPQSSCEPDYSGAVLLPLNFLTSALIGAIGGLTGRPCCERAPYNSSHQAQKTRYERSSHSSRLTTARPRALHFARTRSTRRASASAAPAERGSLTRLTPPRPGRPRLTPSAPERSYRSEWQADGNDDGNTGDLPRPQARSSNHPRAGNA